MASHRADGRIVGRRSSTAHRTDGSRPARRQGRGSEIEHGPHGGPCPVKLVWSSPDSEPERATTEGRGTKWQLIVLSRSAAAVTRGQFAAFVGGDQSAWRPAPP